jgi:tRNA (guanine37-N1)-methyltransferase
MRIDYISVLPQVFEPMLEASILGIAREKALVEYVVHDLRDWTTDRHRTTDDSPFGGGPGMVMKPEPIFAAVRDVGAASPVEATVILLSPQGRTLDQALAGSLAEQDRLVMICGRYEGFDDRVRSLADIEISIGDYVLTGGELPALVVTDAVVRLLPGVLGHESSSHDESFSFGLLEYPQYTRPASFGGMEVPDVLLSGDHARIAAWRRRESIRRTAEVRPELLEHAMLTDEERAFAAEVADAHEREAAK